MFEHFRAPHLLSGLPPETPILVALSGGADSVALLAVLREYAAQHGTPLRIAHVEHGIRGEESVRDRDFCVELATRWDLPISVLNADVPALRQERGGSMEEVARQVRYEFFERVMEEYDIPLLATAHHADDQLETMLLRLTRGTGPDGLCGIPPIRSLGCGRLVIRPLLGCEKALLETYCRENDLDFAVDSTNDDISYARNRIRREVIPHLRAINPAVTRSAVRLADALRTDAESFARQTEGFWREQVRQERTDSNAVGVSVSCEALSKLGESHRRRILLKMMAQAGCSQAEDRFVRSLSSMAVDGGAKQSLPGDVSAYLSGGRLWLCREVSKTSAVSGSIPLDLSDLPQTVIFGDFRLTFSVASLRETDESAEKTPFSENVYKMSMNVALNSDTIKRTMILRARRAGDRFLYHGHHRKVKKLFCDLGVPISLRDRLPLLCDSEGIVCIPGIGVRDGMSMKTDGRALYASVTYIPTDEYLSAETADRNIRNQQKEETDEE